MLKVNRSAGALFALIFVAACATNSQQPAPLGLEVIPREVYKVADPGRERTESWVCNIVVPRTAQPVRPVDVTIELFSGSTLAISEVHRGDAIRAIGRRSYLLLPEIPRPSTTALFTRDESFDLRLVQSRAVSLSIDRMRVTMTLKSAAGTWTEVVDIPLRTYTQKTRLMFPLRTSAIVTQGPFNDRGHAGHANQFAIDVIGLDPNYAPQTRNDDTNEAYAGWRTEVVAPADGVVIYARSDVPNNPAPGEPKTELFASLPEADLAIAGNAVIIDHENGEYSVLMHMQPGFESLRAGSRVRRGEVIGHLGSSGDSFGPHLHYQLQRGPRLFHDSSVPVTFSNLPGATLSRGTYLTPRAE